MHEAGARRNQVALEPHLEARLLERLALGPAGEILAGLDAAAGRPPDPLGEMGLANQRDPVGPDRG